MNNRFDFFFSSLKHIAYLFLLVPFLSIAQLNELNPETAVKNYQLKTWDEIGDIQIERVFDIAQDSLGYIWIGSDKGLLRFDGSQVEVFNMSNSPVLKTESIRNVIVGKNGVIWFNTRRGVYYLKNNQVHDLIPSQKKKIKGIIGFWVSNNGIPWFSTRGKLFYVEEGELKQFKQFKDKFLKIYEGVNGNAWVQLIGKNQNELYKLNSDGQLEKKQIIEGEIPKFFSLKENNKGELFLGDSNGNFYTIKNGKVLCENCNNNGPKSRINGIISDDNGTIWIASQGLQRFVNGHLDVLTEDEGLTSNEVNCLFKDKSGKLWVGTQSGLNYLYNTPFELFELAQKEKPENLNFNEVIQDENGQIIIATSNAGILYLKDKKLTRFKIKGDIGKFIYSICKTYTADEFLVGTELGLFRVKKEGNTISVLKQYVSGIVQSVLESKKGDIFYSLGVEDKTNTAGYIKGCYVIEKGQNKVLVEGDYLLTSWIFENEDGIVYIGSVKGTFQYQNGELSLVEGKGFLDGVFSVEYAKGDGNNFWLGTDGSGLIQFADNDVRKYSTKNGLPINQVYSIVDLKEEGLWFYIKDKNNGKYQRLIPNKLNNGEFEMGKGEIFEIDDDFRVKPSVESAFSDCIAKDGSAYFTGLNGLIRFNPKSIKKTTPKVFLQKIVVEGEHRAIGDKLTFEAGEKDFEFHYAGIDFIKGKHQLYEYKLEGFDDEWHKVGNRMVAYYSQIPSGDYQFKVRLKLPSGEFAQIENPIKFQKKEFWYKTTWAYAGFICFVLLLIVGGFQLRIKSIKEQRRLLQLKVDQRTAELKELNENLEEKVQQRTKKIAEFNEILTESEERYRYAMEASNDGIWDYNVADNKIKYSPSVYTMLGYKPYEFVETREAIYNCYFSEEDKNRRIKLHNEFVGQKEMDSFTDEVKMKSKQGNLVWIQLKGKVVERDENDLPNRIVGIHVDVTDEKNRNQQMLEAVLRTEDAERSRIAKDIHDGLQQTLTVAVLNLQTIKKELNKLSEKVIKKYELGFNYLQNSIADSREVAHSLMPKAIEELGIVPAVQNLIEGIDIAKEDTEFSFFHNLKSEKLPNQQIEITLYRILQEAINNINKYAQASKVDVRLMEYDDIYMLTIEDNGVGFDTEILKKSNKGLGFKSMKNRLDAIDGFIEVDSRLGKGTNIFVEITKTV